MVYSDMMVGFSWDLYRNQPFFTAVQPTLRIQPTRKDDGWRKNRGIMVDLSNMHGSICINLH